MAVIYNAEQDKNSDLTRRINADLKAKMEESTHIGEPDPDLADGSEYVKNFEKTSRFGWVWVVLILLALISMVIIINPFG